MAAINKTTSTISTPTLSSIKGENQHTAGMSTLDSCRFWMTIDSAVFIPSQSSEVISISDDNGDNLEDLLSNNLVDILQCHRLKLLNGWM